MCSLCPLICRKRNTITPIWLNFMDINFMSRVWIMLWMANTCPLEYRSRHHWWTNIFKKSKSKWNILSFLNMNTLKTLLSESTILPNRHSIYIRAVSSPRPGIWGWIFPFILPIFPFTRETETTVYFSILQKIKFWMIELTNTPILPNWQVPNGLFFCITVNFIIQNLIFCKI